MKNYQNNFLIILILWCNISISSDNFYQDGIVLTCAQKKEIDRLYFAPDQAPQFKKDVLWICENTSGSIKAAFYRLTDRDVAHALIVAHQRGVPVEVILDSGAICSRYSLAHQLFKAGISLYRYIPTGLFAPFPRTFPSIMHHKHIIFSGVLQEHSLVACGSLNYTNAGFNGNQEQMQIRSAFHQAFTDHFVILKDRCEVITSEHFADKTKIVTKISKQFLTLKRFLHR